MSNQPTAEARQKAPEGQSPVQVQARKLGLERLDPARAAAMPKLVSADSHVVEPDSLWDDLRKRYELPNVRFGNPLPGGSDPKARLTEMDEDGVEAEILFPNYGMALFGVDNVKLQEEAFVTYNDWVAQFSREDPNRLFGVACLSVYDIDGAVREMHRAHDMGLKGAMVWQVPDPALPFTSMHYEKLWAAAAEADAPVVCHILTGHSYAKNMGKLAGNERIRSAVNVKTNDTISTLFDFIFSGVFERHPKLKLLLAESEIGWLPFMLQQWDYYFDRFRKHNDLQINRMPSEIFAQHVYGTFLEDYVGSRNLGWWGEKNCMWSNDYPHFNMTYPFSRETVEKHLGEMAPDKKRRLVRDNAIELFGLELKGD